MKGWKIFSAAVTNILLILNKYFAHHFMEFLSCKTKTERFPKACINDCT
jgi:hypothetical protein